MAARRAAPHLGDRSRRPAAHVRLARRVVELRPAGGRGAERAAGARAAALTDERADSRSGRRSHLAARQPRCREPVVSRGTAMNAELERARRRSGARLTRAREAVAAHEAALQAEIDLLAQQRFQDALKIGEYRVDPSLTACTRCSSGTSTHPRSGRSRPRSARPRRRRSSSRSRRCSSWC